MNATPKKKRRPWQERYQYDGQVKPEWLNVLKLRSQESLEIVFDDEDTQKIGIAACAADVPGQGSGAERGNGHGMKQSKRVVSSFCEHRGEERARPVQ